MAHLNCLSVYTDNQSLHHPHSLPRRSQRAKLIMAQQLLHQFICQRLLLLVCCLSAICAGNFCLYIYLDFITFPGDGSVDSLGVDTTEKQSVRGFSAEFVNKASKPEFYD